MSDSGLYKTPQGDPLFHRVTKCSENLSDGRMLWIAWLCAAPMPVIGLRVGIYLCRLSLERHAEAVLAENPEAFLCGNQALGPIFLAFTCGPLAGILAGAAVAKLETRLVRKDGQRKPEKGIAADEVDFTTDPGPSEAKCQRIRAEMDLVENLKEQARELGDEETLRKLTDYKFTLEHKLRP